MESFYEQGLKFTCTQCHDCCRHDPGYVFLSLRDLGALSRHFNMSQEDFAAQYCRWVFEGPSRKLSLLEKSNFDCIFWDNGCTVYNARPLQCRTYPFWKQPLSSLEAWKLEARFCPGIGQGKVHSKEEIESLLLSRENDPLIGEGDI